MLASLALRLASAPAAGQTNNPPILPEVGEGGCVEKTGGGPHSTKQAGQNVLATMAPLSGFQRARIRRLR